MHILYRGAGQALRLGQLRYEAQDERKIIHDLQPCSVD